jgi:ferredoxin
LIKGEVYMEDDDVLSKDERAEGYILCCQAQPRSAEIEVEYED